MYYVDMARNIINKLATDNAIRRALRMVAANCGAKKWKEIAEGIERQGVRALDASNAFPNDRSLERISEELDMMDAYAYEILKEKQA